MKRKFTKYPNNKVYATKAYTKGYTTSEPILVSSNGNFQLVIRGGIGVNDTPYTHFEVIPSAKADNAVVDIDIRAYYANGYDGLPIMNLPQKYKNEYADVKYGFQGQYTGNAWIRDTFVPILNEALDFADELNAYFESITPQELSEMCKDVFLDMGIDYDSYIQQEADMDL